MQQNKVNWLNPYAPQGRLWIKGTLHTHTNKSDCGEIPPEEVVRIYEKMGYSFLALTDHGLVSDPRDHRSRLIVLSGIEVDFPNGHHTGIVNADRRAVVFRGSDRQQFLIDRNIRRGGIVILNHPDWQLKEHYTMAELLRLRHYTGIEIYNGLIERLEGASLSTAKWDRLLAAGRRVLGFANQDSHVHGDHFDCCNVARVNSISPQSVMAALRTGNFYCFYGVEILDVGRRRNRVYIQTANARLIRFIGQAGRILKKVKARSAEIEFSGAPQDQYIRIECLGVGEEISWTQPFFRE